MKPIWIVDDDQSIRFVLEKALTREEFAVRSFTNSRDVLAALEDDEPQVLVSDIRMPGGSGIELLNKIKASGEAVLTIPKRASKAAGSISKLTLRVPGLGAKATTYLKKEISGATAEAKASLEANLTAIPEITVKVKASIPESVNKVKAIPAEAKTTVSELTAAFSGDGAFPKLGTPPNAGGEVEGDVVALDLHERGALLGLDASEVLSGHGRSNFACGADDRCPR